MHIAKNVIKIFCNCSHVSSCISDSFEGDGCILLIWFLSALDPPWMEEEKEEEAVACCGSKVTAEWGATEVLCWWKDGSG